ncbi:MAG: hypothetical protein A2Z72_00990 [Omnitrophica bacterium RBG_13_46_9]|nr:MAG: hypothetical protein A2Z72_00990 [Omnitrophica bacterium RBG_13_46_9]
MNNLGRSIFLAICIFFIASNLAWPDDNPEDKYENGLVLPEAFMPYQATIESEIDKKNCLDMFNKTGHVKYNENGTISSVLYTDGTNVSYSYEYDSDGGLKACVLESEGLQIKFENIYDEDNHVNGISVEVYIKDVADIISSTSQESGPPDTPGSGQYVKTEDVSSRGARKGPAYGQKGKDLSIESRHYLEKPGEYKVAIVYPDGKWGLEDIAKTPVKFDFKELKDTVKKVSDAKEKAHQEYLKNTQPYYDELYKELETRFDSLDSEIDLDKRFKEFENAKGLEKRKLIDDAVEYARSRLGKEEGVKPVTEEFLTVEDRCRKEYLESSKLQYDETIEKALEYVYTVIDRLLSSRLALYLDLKKDKIDVVINLSEEKRKVSP